MRYFHVLIALEAKEVGEVEKRVVSARLIPRTHERNSSMRNRVLLAFVLLLSLLPAGGVWVGGRSSGPIQLRCGFSYCPQIVAGGAYHTLDC